MSQVAKLKELLFQPESEAIAKLSRRVEDVFERAGTDTRFEASVAKSIDGALRAAEVAKHDEVSTALAPLVVKTVKREIVNSTDELVEVLYPATGRMVKAYVADAVRDLVEGINRRLESNPLMLRLTAWTSGKSAGEIALAEAQRLRVDDVFLIRRATGELLARWPVATSSSNLDHVFGGVLTAINELTVESFKQQGSSLREIDLGGQKVFLRVSNTYLLAARCSGTESRGCRSVFDDEFLAFVERLLKGATSSAETTGADTVGPALADLGQRIETKLAAVARAQIKMRRGIRPLTLLLVVFGIPLVAWLAWGAYARYVDGTVERVVRDVVEATPAMVGYPNTVTAGSGGSAVTISGLTPTAETRAQLVAKIQQALPGIDVRDNLYSVPAPTDYQPAIAELTALAAANDARLSSRAAGLLTAAAELLRAEAAMNQGDGMLADLARDTQRLATETASAGRGDWSAFIASSRELGGRIEAAMAAVLELGVPPSGARDQLSANDTADPTVTAERVAAAARGLAERGAMKRRLALETAALTTEISALKSAIAQAGKPTARDALIAFTRANAVFFREGVTFRDAAAADLALDSLAQLMMADTSLIRIVGYTDDAGTPARNLALAQERAETVANGLKDRGVPASRFVILKRTSSENNVSPASGPGSSNRRVEFEIGFVGEGGG